MLYLRTFLLSGVSLCLLGSVSSTYAWDGNWTDAQSGTNYINDPDSSHGKPGTSEAPQRFFTTPDRDYNDVDPEELDDYFGKGNHEYVPYALARITQTLHYGNTTVPVGYYLIKPGNLRAGSPHKNALGTAPQNVSTPAANNAPDNPSQPTPQAPAKQQQTPSSFLPGEHPIALTALPYTLAQQVQRTENKADTTPPQDISAGANNTLRLSPAPTSTPGERIYQNPNTVKDAPPSAPEQTASPPTDPASTGGSAPSPTKRGIQKATETLFPQEPLYRTFVIKKLGKVIAVLPIHRVESYIPGRKEKVPKQALAWIETQEHHPVLKFYYKKRLYSTDLQP